MIVKPILVGPGHPTQSYLLHNINQETFEHKCKVVTCTDTLCSQDAFLVCKCLTSRIRSSAFQASSPINAADKAALECADWYLISEDSSFAVIIWLLHILVGVSIDLIRIKYYNQIPMTRQSVSCMCAQAGQQRGCRFSSRYSFDSVQTAETHAVQGCCRRHLTNILCPATLCLPHEIQLGQFRGQH